MERRGTMVTGLGKMTKKVLNQRVLNMYVCIELITRLNVEYSLDLGILCTSIISSKRTGRRGKEGKDGQFFVWRLATLYFVILAKL